MSTFLRSKPVTDEQRRAHDRHSGRVVAAVLVVLAAYAYLFTYAASLLGLPHPGDLVQNFGVLRQFFSDTGIVDSNVRFAFADRFGQTAADLLAFCMIAAGGFLAVYFLPLPYKQPSLVVTAVFALAVIYGVPVTAGLLFAHLLSYMVFHPVRHWGYYALAGALGAVGFAGPDAGAGTVVLLFAGIAVATGVLYRFVIRPLLEGDRVAGWLRLLVAHSGLLVALVFAALEWGWSLDFDMQLGLYLFFWQFFRLIIYQIDYRVGRVPKDTSLMRYLAVFLTPGSIASWDWGGEIGLGYAYCNNSFLSRDKNAIVMSGVKMLWLAMGYMVFGDWLQQHAIAVVSALGVEAYGGFIVNMVDAYMRGGDVPAASVLLTSLLDTLRWTLYFISVVHFKVGVWRICGYDFEPYFDRPWLSTNLVTFWRRYAFYFREFLVQGFYYPVFLNFFKKQPRLRVVIATVAAAGVGNLIWGHMAGRMFYWGMTFDEAAATLHTWPYYGFLSLGIGLTALYLLEFGKKRRRRPWTWSPLLVLDVLSSFLTMQYFAVIHIFSRTSSGANEWDLLKLTLRGIGIHL